MKESEKARMVSRHSRATAELEDNIKALETRATTAESSNAELLAELAEVHESVEALTKANEKLTSAVGVSKKALGAKDGELVELSVRVRELEAELEKQQAIAAEATERADSATAAADALNVSASETTAAVDSLTTELAQSQEANKALEEKLELALQATKAAGQRLKELEEDHSTTATSFDSVRAKYTAVQAENAELKDKLNQAKSILSINRDHYSAIEGEIGIVYVCDVC